MMGRRDRDPHGPVDAGARMTRAEARLECLKLAAAAKRAAASEAGVTDLADELFAWVVEETPTRR